MMSSKYGFKVSALLKVSRKSAASLGEITFFSGMNLATKSCYSDTGEHMPSIYEKGA